MKQFLDDMMSKYGNMAIGKDMDNQQDHINKTGMGPFTFSEGQCY